MKKAEMFKTYLQAEGYVPRIDEDGDVVFKAEGVTYILFGAEDDPDYFRLAVPNFWRIGDDDERLRVLVAAAAITAQMKVAKVQVLRDSVWVSVEMFVSPIENFTRVFPRSLRMLQATMREFREAMEAAD